MAKKTKSETPADTGAVAEAAAPATKEVRAQKAKGDTFVRVMVDGIPAALGQGKRIAPQAQVIVNAIEAAGSITRENLEAALTGVLVTRQPVGRIVSYYQQDLVDLGLITLTKA